MIGTTLGGRYRVLEEVGRGGMGVVYKAFDESLQIPVALKVLRLSGRMDETARKRFHQEALQLASVTHSNVVRVTDNFIDQDLDCLVMEFVPGVTLDETLRGGPLRESRIVDLGMQLADGLSAAHAKRLIHRDLKPGNLRVTPEGRLIILDFGLAKRLLDSTTETASSILTREHTVPGTLPYMAPEQLLGLRVDERVDIYAAGAVLYEMATGQMLFPGRTSDEQLRNAILHEEPQRPRELNAKISAGLERVIQKALAKDPSARYQNAASLVADLNNVGRRAPTPVRWWGAAAALTLVVLGAIFGSRIAPFLWPHRTPKLAVLPFENLSSDPAMEYWADGMTEELIGRLGGLVTQQGIAPDQLTVIGRHSVMKYKHVNDAVRRIGKELGVSYVLDGSVRKEGDRIKVTAHLERASDETQLWGSDYEEDVHDVFKVQDKIAKIIVQTAMPQLLGAFHWAPARPPTLNSAAHDAFLRGLSALNLRTESGLTQAVQRFQEAKAADANYASARAGLADAYILMADYGYLKPAEAMRRAKQEALVALALDDSLAEAHTALASVFADYDWDWEGADREFRRALELNASYPLAHQWYASFLASMGHMDRALEELALAARLDPLSSIVRLELGSYYLNARRYDAAITQYRATFAADTSFGAEDYSLLMIALWKKGDHRGAVTVQEDALRRSGEGEALQGLRNAVAADGDTGLWRWQLEEMQQMARSGYVSPFQMAEIHALLEERDQAMAWLERAYQERCGSLPSLKVSPIFDSLRPDPRFAKLLRRMKLS